MGWSALTALLGIVLLDAALAFHFASYRLDDTHRRVTPSTAVHYPTRITTWSKGIYTHECVSPFATHTSNTALYAVRTRSRPPQTQTKTRTRRKDLTTTTPIDTDQQTPDDTGGGGKRWIRVWPVGMGKYGNDDALFLCKTRQVEEGRKLETLPIPLFYGGDKEMLEAAFKHQDRPMAKASLLWASRHMTVKDNGLLDNLPWQWAGPETKQEAFNVFMGNGLTGDFGSPYGLMLGLMASWLNAEVLDLVIDEEDSIRGGITFGPVVLLRERPPAQTPSGALRDKVVDCLLDEIAGLSLSLQRPIAMPEDLYEGTVVPTRSEGRANGLLRLKAEKAVDRDGVVQDIMARMEKVKPAWDISNPVEFFAMDAQAKRLCLIKSGAESIPKRRKGAEELDFALLPFLDETVRRDARIVLALQAGDSKLVDKLVDGKSKRSKIKDRLQEALRQGDFELAQQLEEDFTLSTMCKLDPTLDEGSYSKDLDADEWYIRNRKT